MRLSHRDLTALISALPGLYARASLDAIPQKILLLASTLVPCFTATYDEWDIDREGRVRGYRAVQAPVISEVDAMLPALPLHIHDHPLFPSLQQQITSPLKISDVASQREFMRTAVYNEVYRHLGVHHQMVWFLPGQQSPHVCLVMSRQGKDFSERDRQMLLLLSPHLRQAHQNALSAAEARSAGQPPSDAPAERAFEAVQLNGNERPVFLSTRAAEWLKTYFNDAACLDPWPETLRGWVRRQSWEANPTEESLALRKPLVRDRGESRLTVTFLPGRDGSGLLLLSETRTAPWPKDVLRSLPLSLREQDVFRWICEGKTNPEIALILRISRRTVDKHVEHVLERLGLENRFQAQRLGWEFRAKSRRIRIRPFD